MFENHKGATGMEDKEEDGIIEGMIKELKSKEGPQLMGDYGPLWWIVIMISIPFGGFLCLNLMTLIGEINTLF